MLALRAFYLLAASAAFTSPRSAARHRQGATVCAARGGSAPRRARGARRPAPLAGSSAAVARAARDDDGLDLDARDRVVSRAFEPGANASATAGLGAADGDDGLSGAMIAAIRGYKEYLSPLLPPACRFYPTCSVYAVAAIREFGPARGGVLTAWRIARCSPIGGKGYDPPQWPPPGFLAGGRIPIPDGASLPARDPPRDEGGVVSDDDGD